MKPNKRDEAAEAVRVGVARHQAGAFPEAEAAYRRALELAPDLPDALAMMGVLAHQTGRGDLAVRQLRRAAMLQPASANHLNNLGCVLRELRRTGEAVAAYRKAVRLQRNVPEIHRNLGCALADQGRLEPAVESFRAALALNPFYVDAADDLGNALVALGRPQEALGCFEMAIGMRPANPALRNNFGLALLALDRLDDALACFREAVRLQPGYVKALSNLGALLLRQRRLTEALTILRRGLEHAPDSADLMWNFANVALALGDYQTGWTAYEARWRMPELASASLQSGAPSWNGTDSLSGRTILLFAEQGFGDTIQFVRFAPLLADTGAKVMLLVQPALVSLVERISGVSACFGFGARLPEIDLQYPLMSLPFALKTLLDSIPARCPYLAPQSEAASAWGDRLARLPGIKVGLVWAGDPRPDQPEVSRVDRRRSLCFDQLAPLAGLENVSFVSLQKGKPAEQARAGLPGLVLHDWTEELRSFADTAALAQNLDLVISADTAVAHLAGALGRPVWLLNRFDSCWRWLDGRDDSPWYPTLRQFRQTAPGDWAGVMLRVRAALEAWAR